MKALKELYLEIFNSIDFDKINDHPNILIAAHFWEEDKFRAARTCYKFMRQIDDLIDNHKASHITISEDEKIQFKSNVDRWLQMIFNGNEDGMVQKELTETIRKFRIPSWPLESFAKSMVYDINNDGFPTLNSFLEYSAGASVAPAAIFVHLAGLRRNGEGFEPPLFEVKEAATSCALFSYLVHIIRDFQKDQLNNLNYFADDIIQKNGLTKKDLAEIARGKPVTEGFRNIIGEYMELANHYREKTGNCITNIWPYLEPRYQLSLEIIFNLYLMVFERIDIEKGMFTSAELNPTPEESRQKVFKVIMQSETLNE